MADFLKPRRDAPKPAPNILPILGAAHRISPERLAAARVEFATLEALPSPRVALLMGCVQSVLDPGINAATIRLLNRLGFEVVVSGEEACCGSLTHHMGKEADALARARRRLAGFQADPARHLRHAAKVLLSQGADVLSQHTDSAAPLQEAEKAGAVGFGQASDMIKFAPKSQLTAIVDNWAPYYVRRVGQVLDGTWKSESSWDGMAEGTVGLAPYTNVPDDVAKAAAETAEAIKTGKMHPFTGPITKQDGTVVGEAGKPLADGDILGMNWYVKGIDDKLLQ